MIANVKAYLRQLAQIGMVAQYIAWFVVFGPLLMLCYVALFFTPLFVVPALYAAWCYYDRKTPFQGGRRSTWLRNQPVYRYFAEYFPVTLHKTADLDPSKCYILVHHPHAVLGISNFINFATEGTGVSLNFPGITFYPLTLDNNFFIPIMREMMLALGMGAVSASSIVHKMTKLGAGHAVSIVVGGAAEAGETDPSDPYRLVLKDRKGFVKMALKTGASFVAVFSFGEADIFSVFKPKPESFFLNIQKLSHKYLKFWPVVFYGRGLIPYRKPIHTVVGTPIDIPLIPEASPEDVSKYHAIYVDALRKLFNENVSKYGDPSKELKIVEEQKI